MQQNLSKKKKLNVDEKTLRRRGSLDWFENLQIKMF